MTEWSPLPDLDAALGSEYIVVREMPQAAGFHAFAARSGSTGANVEIKTIPLEMLGNQSPVGESDLSARRLQHPNIVPVLKAGTSGDTFYWISPEIDGRTLRSRLSRGGKMDVRDSLTVLRDVSAGLTHAHLHGVVHGGLTPDSILISGGSALVSDIGIAEAFTAMRRGQTSGRMMTPSGGEPVRYASPEQASGGKADTRSDVYAWGVIAYELLGGRHPFAGRTTPREMMVAHSDEEPPSFPGGATDIPAGVTRLVMRCLSKNPAKRPETARGILDAMTKEMLVPEAAPPAGTGQKAVIAIMIFAVVAMAVIAWLGMKP
ncbi:MAG TPA: serine/threonine-protein kinase [Gemmatimonadaceae bacterium]